MAATMIPPEAEAVGFWLIGQVSRLVQCTQRDSLGGVLHSHEFCMWLILYNKFRSRPVV